MEQKTKIWLSDFLILNFGTLLTAIGSYFFKFPNNFSTGGVTGISVVLAHYYPQLSNGTIVSVINIALMVVGLLLLGKEFGFKTFYVTIALSADEAFDRPAVYGGAAGRFPAGVGFGVAV